MVVNVLSFHFTRKGSTAPVVAQSQHHDHGFCTRGSICIEGYRLGFGSIVVTMWVEFEFALKEKTKYLNVEYSVSPFAL